MAGPRPGQPVYGVATMDNRGRLIDSVVQRALGWVAHVQLDIREHGGVILVRADRHGAFCVSNDGYLRLPPTVRRCCGLAPGDRVVLAANADANLLTVYPTAVLDALLASPAAALVGGAA